VCASNERESRMDPAKIPDRILSFSEAAQMLGVSERTLSRMEELPEVRLSLRRVGFPQSGPAEWLKARTYPQAAA
jgi:predicted DNA-binding transcriptional regulator AlpA